MLKRGENTIAGISVFVEAKHVRRINLRVRRDGSAYLSYPERGCSLKECWKFLEANWGWLVSAVSGARARESVSGASAPNGIALENLRELVTALDGLWRARLGIAHVEISFRAMRSSWGVCNWRKRIITYSTQLASKPRRQVEYVVIHELTHLEVHDHGPMFKALLDARMPDWRDVRRALNAR